ncbi:hypothetical protein HDU93_007046 [Gonapodya sp. JEL0774]|nr:hypothetical protein HDU93_007046 [Gonapodya sp. JEL0774]
MSTLESEAHSRLRLQWEISSINPESDNNIKEADHASSYHEWKNSDEIETIQNALLKWYDDSFASGTQRNMPWRIHDTKETTTKSTDQRAYEIWLSEVMLQQTQVERARPYFMKWIEKWPTIKDLAEATESDVRALWSGLGYYTRATRLLDAARLVVEKFEGKLPESVQVLQRELPGIGRYTAAAIASIAYGLPTAVVDGNVVRVLSRLRAIGGDPKSKSVETLFWSLASALLSPFRPGAFNQALMDLGATVCTPRRPNCNGCVLRNVCRARAEEVAFSQISTPTDIEDAPQRKSARPTRNYTIIVVERINPDGENEIRIRRREEGGLLGGLWEFAMIEKSSSGQLHEGMSDMHDQNTGGKRKRTGGDMGATKGISQHAGKAEFNAPPTPGSSDCQRHAASSAVRDLLKIEIGDFGCSTPKNILSGRPNEYTVSSCEQLGNVTHVFSHLAWKMDVEHWVVVTASPEKDLTEDGFAWVKAKELDKFAMGNGMRKVWNMVEGKESEKQEKTNPTKKKKGTAVSRKKS